MTVFIFKGMAFLELPTFYLSILGPLSLTGHPCHTHRRAEILRALEQISEQSKILGPAGLFEIFTFTIELAAIVLRTDEIKATATGWRVEMRLL